MNLTHRTLNWLIGLLCALLAFQGSVTAVHLLARTAHHVPGTGHKHVAATDEPLTHQARAMSTDDCGSGGTGHCVSAAQPALIDRGAPPPVGAPHNTPLASEVHFSSVHTQPPEPRPKSPGLA